MDYDDEFLEDDFFQKRKAIAPPEKHLQSPIVITLLQRLTALHQQLISMSRTRRENLTGLSRQPRIENDFKSLYRTLNLISDEHSYSQLERISTPWLESLRGTTRLPNILMPSDYPKMFSYASVDSFLELQSALDLASRLYALELSAFGDWALIKELQEYVMQEKEDLKECRLSSDTTTCYKYWKFWDTIVEEYRLIKMRNTFGKMRTISNKKFYFFDGFVMLVETENQVPVGTQISPPNRIMITYEQLQMLQDALYARVNVYLALDLGLHNGTPGLKPLITKILRWQEDCLKNYGNAGYDLVKGPESVFKARLTSLTKGDCLFLSSYERTIEKLRTKERKLNKENNTHLTDVLHGLAMECDNLNDAAELFGCTKLSGHPIVDPKESARSVREHAVTVGRSNLKSISEMQWTFMLSTLVEYVRKHREWPPFKSPPKKGTTLYELWDLRAKNVSRSSIPLSDFEDVQFAKFLEFDYSPDYLDLIDDKAISPGASNVSSFWNKGSSTESRRLLETLINRKEINTFELVERLRRGQFSDEEKIIELTQKEREFKIAARCFCKLVFEVRLFFVLTEMNLKKFMGGSSGKSGYMPEQTMTLGQSDLLQRLYQMTKVRNQDKNNSCIVEVDFARWNLKWRAQTVNPIARVLDDIFGLPGVFSRAHAFFEESTVVLTDKHSAPPGSLTSMKPSEWPESDLVWRNHKGGFEGIQQTLWTICTITMMRWALRKENVAFDMIGQGDNQVFHFWFNARKPLRSQLEKLLSNMDFHCSLVNHEVKPEECIDSKSVLTYSKVIYVNGVHIQYSLKFSSRTFARSDYSMPSLSKEVASIMANSMNIAAGLKNTFRVNLWKSLHLGLLLKSRLRYNLHRVEHSSIKQLLKYPDALLIPGSLGGLPIIPWTRFFSRGETDDLSYDVAAMHYLCKHSPLISGWNYHLHSGAFFNKKPDPANLVSDPHSIPIERPSDMSHIVADLVGKSLPHQVKNYDLSQLIDRSLASTGEQFKRWLSTMRPIYPVIARDLFDVSPAGLYEKTIKRFTMTRTITNIVGGMDVTYKISQATVAILKQLAERSKISILESRSLSRSPYISTQLYRSRWGLDVQNSLIGVYTPFDFKLKYHSDNTPDIHVSTTTSSDKLLNTYGQSSPNFGTATKQKTTDHGYKISNTNSAVIALKKIVMIASELNYSENLRSLFDTLINARSPWTLEDLEGILATSIGGVAAHRHQSYSHQFSLMGSSSLPTHLIYSSDNAGILSGGEMDYPVVFQSLFLTLSNLYQLLSSRMISVPSTMAYLIPSSLDPILETNVQIDQSTPIITWPPLSSNKLAYTSTLSANEVPGIPDRTLVKDLKPESSPLACLRVYLEEHAYPPIRYNNRWDTIKISKDIVDLKEINRYDPFDVEIVIAWVVYKEIVHTLVTSTYSGKSLRAMARDISFPLAEQWVRLRLHPSFHDSNYNKHRDIRLIPGPEGYKRSVRYVVSRILRHVLSYQDGTLTPPDDRFILTPGWEKRLTSFVIREVAPRMIVGHTSSQFKPIFDRIKNVSPPTTLRTASPTLYLVDYLERCEREHRHTISPEWPRSLYYTSVRAGDLLRPIRLLPPIKEQPRLSNRNKVSIINHGYIKYVASYVDGELLPEIDEYRTVSPESRLRILTRRKAGIYSPLYSDWSAVLSSNINFFTVNNASVFGVGRGAVCRALIENNVRVKGFDLRSIIPILSHRSSSFKPPEVYEADNPEYFLWSDHFQTTSGNFITYHPTEDLGELIVLDFDASLKDVLTLYRRLKLTSRRVVRFRGTVDEVKSLISALSPVRIVCLMNDGNTLFDVVLLIDENTVYTSPNYRSINITRSDEIQYRITPDSVLERIKEADQETFRELTELGITVESEVLQYIKLKYKNNPNTPVRVSAIISET